MENKKHPKIDKISSVAFDLQEALKDFIEIVSILQKDLDKIKTTLKID